MKTVAAKLYEGMFLVDSALAASDWQGVNDTIRSILGKVDAEIVSVNKWDERRLAYDIKGESRGTYILAYFRVDGPKVAQIERAAQLSEDIMRVLILSVEGLDEKRITKEAPVMTAKSGASEDTLESSLDDTGDEEETLGEETEEQDVGQMDFFAEGEVADSPELWQQDEDRQQ